MSVDVANKTRWAGVGVVELSKSGWLSLAHAG